ncbi:MAG: hypothetical protein VB108_01735 [Anaerolineaceae bacterium]|nr:hypothetical protein [Anaerolineaceae bacterium]
MKLSKISAMLLQEVSKENWSTLDIWPKIRCELPAENRKGFTLKLLRAFGTTLVVFGLLSAVLFFSPAGRAFAQEIIHFFQPVEAPKVQEADKNIDLVVVAPEAQALETQEKAQAAEVCDQPWCKSLLSIEDAGKLAGYTILSFPNQPEDLTHVTADFIDGKVYLYYVTDKGYLTLAQWPKGESNDQTFKVGKDAVIETAVIWHYPAEMISGAWFSSELGKSFEWKETPYNYTLRWQTEDLNLMLFAGPDQIHGNFAYTKEDLIDFAQGLKPTTVGEVLPNLDRSTLDTVQKRIGFKAAELSSLPANFHFDHAMLDQNTNSICQYFSDGSLNLMVLAQNKTGWPRTQYLSESSEMMGQKISTPIVEEKVDLGNGVEGSYISSGLINAIPVCAGENLPPQHMLIWSGGGDHYMIYGARAGGNYTSSYVSRKEMVAMAKSINGEVNPDTSPDPERLSSKIEAEELFGVQIAFPREMLANFHFRGIGKIGEGLSNATPSSSIRTTFTGPNTNGYWPEFIRIEQFPEAYPLENLMGSGLVQKVSIWGVPAVLRNFCTPMLNDPATHQCLVEMTWIEQGTEYNLTMVSSTYYSDETMLRIAESMKP